VIPDTRPRVLLADDYAGILTALRRLLEPSCEVVGCVADGITLLEEAKRLEPDVIVLDVAIPAINGIEACRRIKDARPQTKIVFLTATDDAAVTQKAYKAGASAFVSKYVMADQLIGAINKAFLDETSRSG
jgi:DNA-binding NarL/FixJ family response regulator